MPNDEMVKRITGAVAKNFRSFGGGDPNVGNNPVAAAWKDKPARFAAGVDIEEVVRFVLQEAEK